MKNIGQQIKETARAFNAVMDRFADQYGLTGTQLSLIDFLGKQPGQSCTQKQVEQEFNIRRSTTTVMLQRMVNRELIQRVTAPDDGRQKVIILTAKGQALVPVVGEFIARNDQSLAEVVDLAQLKTMLNKVNGVLRNE